MDCSITATRADGKSVIHRHSAKVSVRLHASGRLDIELGPFALGLTPSQADDLLRLLGKVHTKAAPEAATEGR